jgi:hypothetical protein
MRGRSGLEIGARRSGGGVVGGGYARAPYYRVGGGAGRLGNRRESAAVVVHHDGGGGGRFGRGSTGRWWGVMRWGVLRPFQEQKGGVGRRRACAHVRRGWRHRPFGPGRKMTGRGPPVGERGRVGWLGRPKVEAQWRVVAVAQWEGKGEWADRGRRRGGPRVGRIRSWARIQKEILFEFQLILEFDRTLKNCTRRFRRNFDMEIFSKIFYTIQVF